MASPDSPSLSIEADLAFSVEVPGDRTVNGVLTGSGTALELTVSDPLAFAGRSDARAVRGIAAALAARGLSLTVVAPSGPLVTLGAPHTPWWQRRVTGSRHIRIERGAGLWSLARGRARATAGALPVLAPRVDGPSGGTRQVFALRRDVTTIGSAPDSDIVLPGLATRHAEVWHDERDEFVLVRLAEREETLVNGAPADTAVLRTASRIRLGEVTMSFYREEYADHGRPYGGRIGGELGRQRPQPPRPATAGGPARPPGSDRPTGDFS
jgi:hypothetical protein